MQPREAPYRKMPPTSHGSGRWPAGLRQRGAQMKIRWRWKRLFAGIRSPFDVPRPRPVSQQHLLHAAQCLPGSLLILDQCEANVVIPVLAEADTGTHGHFSLRQQLF